MAKKRIIGVIGLGHVGAHVAYSLAVQGIADELVLVDQEKQKLASEVQDLRDAAAYLPHRVTVRAGDFSDLGECDVIVNSVGKIELLETHDRLTEMAFTIPAVRSYAHKIKASGFDGVLINITNPCDIVTRELALGLDFPKGRVFGTGTGLDTCRRVQPAAADPPSSIAFPVRCRKPLRAGKLSFSRRVFAVSRQKERQAQPAALFV